jgi:hypothetical protein
MEENAPAEIVELLFRKFEQGARTADLSNKYPLHYVFGSGSIAEGWRMVFDAHPDAKDAFCIGGRTPHDYGRSQIKGGIWSDFEEKEKSVLQEIKPEKSSSSRRTTPATPG